jgi:hypothetical protein
VVPFATGFFSRFHWHEENEGENPTLGFNQKQMPFFSQKVFDLGFLQGHVRGVFELPTKKRAKIQEKAFLRR